MKSIHRVIALLLLFSCHWKEFGEAFSPITVTTVTRIPDQTPQAVQNFLASPGNWPKIVSTSMGVSSNENVTQPLPVGKTVDELFGLPPILPLYVTWTCIKDAPRKAAATNRLEKRTSSSTGQLEFFSESGLEGVAENCEMKFDIAGDREGGTDVQLKMSYQPVSPLAILAVPILTLDNTVALKFLLPAAMRQLPELDKFRDFMGILYGVAGLAHLADCLLGPSQLLTMAGAPPFELLPLTGQAYALLWCLVGPVSWGLSKVGAGFADIGLILYGLVEVLGALLISINYGTNIYASDSQMNPFANALLVQAVVASAWIYSGSIVQGGTK